MTEPLVSIVAGAARGIGWGIAEALARRGDRLVLADIAFADPTLRSQVGLTAVVTETNIADAKAVDQLVNDTVNRFGRVDCMINAVGVNRPAPIHEASEADWDFTLMVNLKGAFLLSRAAAKVMMKQRRGRIVHICSTASQFAAPCSSAYAASKHGLLGLIKAAACDLTSYGITVNGVSPGNVETEMLRLVLEQRARHFGRTYDDVRDEIVRKTPAGRLGRPGDIAEAVLFLTSEGAEYVTGQTLVVDGGRTINLV